MSTIAQVHVARRWSSVTAASLIVSAWLALAAWSISPYAKWLDHARMEEIAAPPAVRLVIFSLGWTLMIVAMMLPGTLLLLARCAENVILSARTMVWIVLAYLAVWIVFGAFSYWGDTVLHEIVEHHPALAGAIAPGVVLLAGVYELSPLKRACLARCRTEISPLKAVGQVGRYSLWALGLQLSLYCLGSCWALMLLMFALGGVNLVWMLILGMIMTVERLSRQGERIALLGGVTLVFTAVLLVIVR